MKGTIRIVGALAIGILVILGALYVQGGKETTATGTVVAQAPERTSIAVTDSNNNGVQDWEESLTGKIYETIETPTSTISLETEEEYTPPTTFTGKFSEAFLKDYLEGKIDGQDFSDPSAFIGTAITAIEKNTQSKRHSRLELTIIPDSDEAVRAYGNRVAEIMKTHSIDNENEAVILQKALTANDPALLEPLAPIKDVYGKTIVDTLRMDVPESLALTHLDLLNAYEAIFTDIEAMQQAFTDPLIALARTKGYEADSTQLYTALKNIALSLNARGVAYANDEHGSFFYIFDI